MNNGGMSSAVPLLSPGLIIWAEHSPLIPSFTHYTYQSLIDIIGTGILYLYPLNIHDIFN